MMRIHWYRRAAATAVLGAVLAVASACDDLLKPSIRTYKGADIAIGAGLGWTEMVFEAGDLQELSVVFTPGALDDLPPTLPGTEFILPLPSDAPTTAFDHIGINWQPEGHPPPMVYTHPHFDVHYYFISVAERDAITPADPSYEAKVAAQPTAEEMPPGYVADPMGVPGMGNHWTNADSHEFHGAMFTNTLVYGFYDAKMIFVEPMITRGYLLADPDDTQTMQVPQKYPEAGRYPTSYRVWHDASAGRYRIELLDFVTRN